jgi:DNA-binding GntR family transcriptional regulator
MKLDTLLKNSNLSSPSLERNSLKVQSTDLLRALIIGGQIPLGTRIVEQDLADSLSISRMPVRDALIQLEHEGLIESRTNGRYVIQLDDRDIQRLFQVRSVLERLAVERAVLHRTADNDQQLRDSLQRLEQAIAHEERDAYAKSDLEAHQLIWQQAQNPYLLKMLNSIIGPIFMFMASQTDFQYTWEKTLQMHRELTEAICDGDVDRAVCSMDAQLQYSLELTLCAYEQAQQTS